MDLSTLTKTILDEGLDQVEETPGIPKSNTSFDQVFVATYPLVGGRRETHGCVFQRRKMHGVATNVYLRKTLEKPKSGLRILRNKGSGVVYARGRYQHFMRSSQGTTTFNQMCKIITFILSLFSLFYVFLYLLGSTRAGLLLLRILNRNEELRPAQFFEKQESYAGC